MSDSPVISFINKATDLILLNFLWLITCIPIATIGAATSAAYYVTLRSIKNGDGYVASTYFKAFKKNFKQATIAWLGILTLAVAYYFNLIIVNNLMEKNIADVVRVTMSAFMIFIFAVSIYIFPNIAKFENSMKTHIKNSFLFSIAYMPQTILMCLFLGGVIWLNTKSIVLNFIMLFIGFALVMYILSFFIFKIFARFTNEKWEYEEIETVENI